MTLPILGLCAASFAISWLGTWAMRRIAPQIGFVDRPGRRKIHHNPKPLGGGVVATAAKRGLAPVELIERATHLMATLNREASLTALRAGVSAMTDVTGYGLLGHLREMAEASGVSAEVSAGAVPAIEGVIDLLEGPEPPVAGGTRANREWVEGLVSWAPEVPEARRWLLCDAMTSGGLLVAAPASSEAPGVRIGTVLESSEEGATLLRVLP